MKKLILFILVICMVSLSACNSADKDTVETSGTTASTSVALTTEEIYNAYLTKLCTKLNNIISDDTHLDGFNLQKGMSGVAEIAQQRGLDLLNKFGYAVIDVNGDGVDELFICQVDEMTDSSCVGTKILCAYTASENDVVLLFESNCENCCYYLGEAVFYNVASSDGNHAVSEAFEGNEVVFEKTPEDLSSRIQKIGLISLAAFAG